MPLPSPTLGYHSIMFIDNISNIANNSEMYRHTYDSWHLVPTKRPSIEPPDVKTFYGNLNGSDGQQDLTEVLSGRPLYGMRIGSIEFLILNGYKPWSDLYTELLIYFHGQQRDMILEDDLAYFYRGRFTLSNYDTQKDYSRITLNYTLEPYKRDINTYVKSWLWDPFDFTTGERLIKSVTDEFTLVSGTSYSDKYINLPSSSAAYLCHITTYEKKPSNATYTNSVVRLHYTDVNGVDRVKSLFDFDGYNSNGETWKEYDLDITIIPTITNSFRIACNRGHVYVRLTYNLGIL